MRRQFKGERCTYCVLAPAATDDHVLARKFFLEHHRQNLPQVPACKRCNGEKARLEDYLMATAPFGGRHTDSMATLLKVERRLANNLRLKRELAASLKREWRVGADGLWREMMTLKFEGDKLAELSTYIARGLAKHHWGLLLPPTHSATAFSITAEGEDLFRQLLAKNKRAEISANIGDGTFVYDGGQGTDDPALTVWRFSLYGLKGGGDPRAAEATTRAVIALTGRRELMAKFSNTK